MKKMQQAPTTFTTDAHGQRLAHVALANTSQRATLYAEDLERLLAAGWSPYWTHTSTGGRFRYVLARAANPRGRQRSITVARLIVQTAKGFRVEYIDGDRCNLRRDNLRAVKGGGYAPTAAAALHPGTVEFIAVRPMKKKAAGGGCTTPKSAPAQVAAADRGAVPAHVVSPEVFTPRTIDRGALSARVRERMRHTGP